MIPNIQVLSTPIVERTHSNKTYNIVVNPSIIVGNDSYKNRIKGTITDLEAVEQSVYLALGTERYRFPIYSWDYGIELLNLYGKPMPYVMAELPERIKEALRVDDRIIDATDFKFVQNGRTLTVSFTVLTKHGELPSRLEVDV